MLTSFFVGLAVLFAINRPVAGQTFQDVTAAVGLTGLSGSNAAWGDYNNDGWVDLQADSMLFHNNGGNNFTARMTLGRDGIFGDFNNDGFLDFFSHVSRTLYKNNRAKSFSPVAIPNLGAMISNGATWADLDGDHFLDLYVGGYETFSSTYHPDKILTNNTNETFSITWTQQSDAVVRPARGITSADWDQDGDIDVFVSNYRLQPNQLRRNDGAGDLSNDVAGTHNATHRRSHSIGAVFGDFNNDGLMDLFSGNFSHRGQPESHFLKNEGANADYAFQDFGTAGVERQESYASPTAGDIDNDGDLDLYFTTVYSGDNPRLYRNDGGWVFTDVTAKWGLNGLGRTYQAAFADYNNDGYLDLVTRGKLFENPGGTNHYLKIRLDGDGVLDATGIGTQVRINMGNEVLTRQVEGAVGEGNQNDHTLHFGLGNTTGQVPIEVVWPDGHVQHLAARVDQTIRVARTDPDDPCPAGWPVGPSSKSIFNVMNDDYGTGPGKVGHADRPIKVVAIEKGGTWTDNADSTTIQSDPGPGRIQVQWMYGDLDGGTVPFEGRGATLTDDWAVNYGLTVSGLDRGGEEVRMFSLASGSSGNAADNHAIKILQGSGLYDWDNSLIISNEEFNYTTCHDYLLRHWSTPPAGLVDSDGNAVVGGGPTAPAYMSIDGGPLHRIDSYDSNGDPPVMYFRSDDSVAATESVAMEFHYMRMGSHVPSNRIPAFADVNNDGVLDNLDITPFIHALAAGGDKEQFLDLVSSGRFHAADANGDSFINDLDITPFINLLNATGSTATAVPEPSSIACGLLALMMACKRSMKR